MKGCPLPPSRYTAPGTGLPLTLLSCLVPPQPATQGTETLLLPERQWPGAVSSEDPGPVPSYRGMQQEIAGPFAPNTALTSLCP